MSGDFPENRPDTEWSVVNEHGVWCPHCGSMVASPWTAAADWAEPDCCRECGFPDDLARMVEVMAP